jgi:hypothetical protein
VRHQATDVFHRISQYRKRLGRQDDRFFAIYSSPHTLIDAVQLKWLGTLSRSPPPIGSLLPRLYVMQGYPALFHAAGLNLILNRYDFSTLTSRQIPVSFSNLVQFHDLSTCLGTGNRVLRGLMRC